MTFLSRALPATFALACSLLLGACAGGPGVDVSAVRQVPQAAPLPDGGEIRPFRAGETLAWRIAA